MLLAYLLLTIVFILSLFCLTSIGIILYVMYCRNSSRLPHIIFVYYDRTLEHSPYLPQMIHCLYACLFILFFLSLICIQAICIVLYQRVRERSTPSENVIIVVGTMTER